MRKNSAKAAILLSTVVVSCGFGRKILSISVSRNDKKYVEEFLGPGASLKSNGLLLAGHPTPQKIHSNSSMTFELLAKFIHLPLFRNGKN